MMINARKTASEEHCGYVDWRGYRGAVEPLPDGGEELA